MSSLYEVLHALEETDGPVSLSQLSRRLHVEPGALEGMLMFWVRKGRLRVVEQTTCDTTLCGTCPVVGKGCPVLSYALRRYEKVRQADVPE
jgi:hypothetical protein